MSRCYCYVACCDHWNTCIEPCNGEPFNGTDFCKYHLIQFNVKKNSIRVEPDRVSYVSPSGRVIMDDTWFRRNERYFKGYQSKLIAGSNYTWIFVYYMVKRIEAKLKRFEGYIPATKLQRAWKRCISDPNYLMCRKRLQREANDIENMNS